MEKNLDISREIDYAEATIFSESDLEFLRDDYPVEFQIFYGNMPLIVKLEYGIPPKSNFPILYLDSLFGCYSGNHLLP